MANYNYTKKTKLGFTLIELLIAIAIFGLVATIVYTTLYTGIKAYHRTQAELQLHQDVNQILDRLSIELRNCCNEIYQEAEDKGGFRADAQSLSFCTIQDVYSEGGFKKSLARISYRFSEGKLLKKTQIDKNVFLENDNFQEEELLGDIYSLTFEYLYFKKIFSEGEYPFEWRPVWLEKKYIPKAVRVEIVKLDSQKNIDISVRRFIEIPQGYVGAQEELRGL